jgi:aminoglycoside phosphotransferase (APT) family kinase protein
VVRQAGLGNVGQAPRLNLTQLRALLGSQAAARCHRGGSGHGAWQIAAQHALELDIRQRQGCGLGLLLAAFIESNRIGLKRPTLIVEITNIPVAHQVESAVECKACRARIGHRLSHVAEVMRLQEPQTHELMTTATNIAEFTTRLEAYLGKTCGTQVQLSNVVRLTGGASRDTWSIDARIAGGPDAGLHRLILRRDWGGLIQPETLSRRQEFEVLQAMWAAGVKVPRPRWLCEDPHVLDVPFFLMDRLEGESVGRRVVREASLAEGRKRLPRQLGEQMARIHRVDPKATGLDFLPKPPADVRPGAHAVAKARAQLDALGEPHPVLEWGMRWLEQHAPPCPKIVLVHGDFRIGNIMVGPDGLQGIFDWEFCHVGDPTEDLAWPCVRAWRFGQDNLDFGGVARMDEFLDAYRSAGGCTFEPASIRFWEILGNLRWALGCVAQADRHLSGLAPSVELASLGRRAVDMELELMNLIDEELARE